MTTHAAIYRVTGQIGEDLLTQVEDVDLTGKTVSLTVRYDDGGELVKDANIFDPANGWFSISWDADDLPVGTHCAEWTITSPGPPVSVTRFPAQQPFKIVVRSQV
jgi:hypothetical protein